MIKEFYDSIGGSYEKALPRLMKDKLIEKYGYEWTLQAHV